MNNEVMIGIFFVAIMFAILGGAGILGIIYFVKKMKRALGIINENK